LLPGKRRRLRNLQVLHRRFRGRVRLRRGRVLRGRRRPYRNRPLSRRLAKMKSHERVSAIRYQEPGRAKRDPKRSRCSVPLREPMSMSTVRSDCATAERPGRLDDLADLGCSGAAPLREEKTQDQHATASCGHLEGQRRPQEGTVYRAPTGTAQVQEGGVKPPLRERIILEILVG